MRDHGLEKAIRAAGGIGVLARKIGISQPSVSNWSRIPAERVIAVEAVTGIDRALLRPDLYMSAEALSGREAIESGRAETYLLLATLLAAPPAQTLLDALSRRRWGAQQLGRACGAMAQAAATTTAEKVEREYFRLFVGIGRGELLPYASFYLTGFLHERPLARLRQDLAKLGIERANGQTEPEDHVAFLCELMSDLISRRFNAPAAAEREMFATHLCSWVGTFFGDLERAESADFYRSVGGLGRIFLEIEMEAFMLSTPVHFRPSPFAMFAAELILVISSRSRYLISLMFNEVSSRSLTTRSSESSDNLTR